MDLRRVSQHQEWLSWLKSDQTAPEPPPGFKDCRRCPLRLDFRGDPQGRRALCRECPYEAAAKADGDALPASAGFWFYYIAELACYPPEIIAREAAGIGRQALRDLHTYRQWQEDRKEARKFEMMTMAAYKKVMSPSGR